jgi:lysozyme family protein
MSERFLKFFGYLVPNEGTYSDDPNDSGGKTIYGISQNSFPSQFAQCYALYKRSPVIALNFAQGFYYANFYKPIYEKILDEKVAFKVYDLAINMNPPPAIKILQRAVGCVDDGIFGQNTLSAVNSKDCYQDFLTEAEKHYRDIVVAHPEKGKYLNGWLNRLARTC